MEGPVSLSGCAASNCVTQLAACLLEMDVFEMNASAIKSLLSDTYSEGGDYYEHLWAYFYIGL